MKQTRRFSALLLSLLLMVSLLLSACGKEQPNPTDPTKPTELGEATYKVTVVDGLGNPYTEKIIVKFLQNGTQIAMGPVNKEGSFEKVLTRGDYTVEVASTNSSLDCHFLPVSLTADVTEAQVIMAYKPTETGEIGVQTGEVDSEGNGILYQADRVNVGSAYIELDAGERTYVVFTPSVSGTYEFSVSNDDAVLGYYGSPHFVQENNVAEMNGNKFSMSISSSMISDGATGTTTVVIGLDAKEGKTGCVLNINRIGDPEWSVEEEPWNNYEPKTPISDFVLPEGVELTPFDVTASTDTYNLVLNEQDGTYRLNSVDGPKVYVQLGVAVYGICMKDMVGEIVYDADGVLIATGTSPFRYMYSNGREDFFKEDYTDVMREYVTAADKVSGVYPLNEDLFYMLPLGIENKGWCRENTINYLFRGMEGLNTEIAWMFLLCYGEETGSENPVDPPVDPDDPVDPPVDPDDPVDPPVDPDDPVEGTQENPIYITGTLEFEAEVKAGEVLYFDLMHVNDTILTIKNKNAYVIYNGRKYEAKSGVVTVPNLYSQYTNLPVQLQIGNKGTEDITFEVTLSYPEGHMENPFNMTEGSVKAKQKSGDSDGIWYTFTAQSAGTLTITVDSTTTGTKAGISITDENSKQINLGEGMNSVSIALEAGQVVTINVCATTDMIGVYPMSTIEMTVSFA